MQAGSIIGRPLVFRMAAILLVTVFVGFLGLPFIILFQVVILGQRSSEIRLQVLISIKMIEEGNHLLDVSVKDGAAHFQDAEMSGTRHSFAIGRNAYVRHDSLQIFGFW